MIDHVARDVAWDMSSAPRKMEVWGLVEGTFNFAKVAAWDAARTRDGQEILVQPRSLLHSVRCVCIAQFKYDADMPNTVQMFPVDEDVHTAGMDFSLENFCTTESMYCRNTTKFNFQNYARTH
jgi:SUN domain-containing protein 1/2